MADARPELPRSGRLLGFAAEFLGLKGMFRKKAGESAETLDDLPGYKTFQRVAQDSTAVPRETLEQLIGVLVDALQPVALVPAEALPSRDFDVVGWARTVACEAALRWDEMVARYQSGSIPITDSKLAPIPFLRLLVLDAAVRWGAYQLLKFESGPVGGGLLVVAGAQDFRPAWLEPDPFRHVMDEGRVETLAKVAKAAKLPEETIKLWRQGKVTPSLDLLPFLTEEMAKETGMSAERLLARLRVAAGAAACRARLVEVLGGGERGKRRVEDFVDAFAITAKHTFDILAVADFTVADRHGRLLEVLHQGAKAGCGRMVCTRLAALAEARPEVAKDFLALAEHSWLDRMTGWAQVLTSGPEVTKRIAAEFGVGQENAAETVEASFELALHMGNYDRRPSKVVVVPSPPNWRADALADQAKGARERRDLGTAIRLMRKAIELAPRSAEHWFFLGCWLGEAGKSQEALDACHWALELNPDWDRPPTEIGIILSDNGRREDAEAMFAAAEPIAKGWHHYQFARGANLLKLGRLEAAERFLREAMTLGAGGKAEAGLAEVLERTGKRDEAAKLRRELERKVGPNWREILLSWLGGLLLLLA